MNQPPSFFQPATTLAKKAVLFFGLRAGLLLGIALSVLLIYWNHGPDMAWTDLTSGTALVLWIAGLMGAGYLTARKIGQIGAGLRSGLLAGGIAGLFVIGTIVAGIVYSYGFDSLAWLFSMLSTYFASLALLLGLSLGAGAGLGALGGLIGQSFFHKAPLPQAPQYQQQHITTTQRNDPSRQ